MGFAEDAVRKNLATDAIDERNRELATYSELMPQIKGIAEQIVHELNRLSWRGGKISRVHATPVTYAQSTEIATYSISQPHYLEIGSDCVVYKHAVIDEIHNRSYDGGIESRSGLCPLDFKQRIGYDQALQIIERLSQELEVLRSQ